MKPEALVVAPGLMCDATAWQMQCDTFATQLPIVVIDYGELDSLPAMATHLLSQAPERFALAGHSMGGRVVLEVMRQLYDQAAQRVTHLALLDTGCHTLPLGEAGEQERITRQAFLIQAQTQGVAAMARSWVQGMVHPSRLHDAPLIDAIVTMFARKSVTIFAAQIRALLARPEAGSLLTGIRCPTLVLGGNEDSNSPPWANREMAASIPDSTLHIVSTCGHMSMMEQPQQVNVALSEWLAH